MNFNKVLDLIRDKSFITGFFLFGIIIFISKFAQADLRFIKVLLIVFLFAAIYLIRFKKYLSFAFGIFSVTFLIIIFYSLSKNYNEFRTIHQWDFFAFYLYGKLGVSGLDFYNPDNIAAIFTSLQPTFEIGKGFYEQVIYVGFPYPPVTMILFAPLGYFNIETANIIWRLLVLIFQIIDIILLIRIFKINLSPGIGILALIGLTLIFPGTLATIFYGQTTFFLLFFLLLTYKNLDNWKSGVFLAISLIIKPLAAVWCLYLIINRRWKPLISLFCSGVLIVLITGAIFGFDNFISYITSPPTERIVASQYTEFINQSLFATLSRLGANLRVESPKVISYLVLIISLILTILTSISSFKIAKSNEKISFLIFVPLSLLVYPASLVYYWIFLIPFFFEILLNKPNPVLQKFFEALLFLFFLGFIFSNLTCFIICLIALISVFVYSFKSNISIS
jgi:hypothetical protein